MKKHASFIVLFAVMTLSSPAFEDETNAQPMEHLHANNHAGMGIRSPLTAVGNDAFAAIQEAIRQLDADPSTDWNKVDLEALRRHLVDMNNITVNVTVISQKPIENGFEAELRPTTNGADESLRRVFAAHPPQLKKETGWIMNVSKSGDLYRLKVTTGNPAEVSRMRGLGYIGVMALGGHHQVHHWAIVKGDNPHSHE